MMLDELADLIEHKGACIFVVGEWQEAGRQERRDRLRCADGDVGGAFMSSASMRGVRRPMSDMTLTAWPFLFARPWPVSFLSVCSVCRLNSRVGATTSACKPLPLLPVSTRESRGSAYAKVLPAPVGQRITVVCNGFREATSLGLRGMSASRTTRWTGVGAKSLILLRREATCEATRNAVHGAVVWHMLAIVASLPHSHTRRRQHTHRRL